LRLSAQGFGGLGAAIALDSFPLPCYNHVSMDSVLKQCLIVGIGGFFGAIARFLINTAVSSRYTPHFPWATFIINISGSFALGLLAALISSHVLTNPNWRLGVTIGFIGAYTTFSTFEYESAALGISWAALGNLLGSVVSGYGAVRLGIWLGQVRSHP